MCSRPNTTNLSRHSRCTSACDPDPVAIEGILLTNVGHNVDSHGTKGRPMTRHDVRVAVPARRTRFRTSHLTLTLTACLVLSVAGCANEPAISTTLTDLIAESNSYSVDPLVDF